MTRASEVRTIDRKSEMTVEQRTHLVLKLLSKQEPGAPIARRAGISEGMEQPRWQRWVGGEGETRGDIRRCTSVNKQRDADSRDTRVNPISMSDAHDLHRRVFLTRVHRRLAALAAALGGASEGVRRRRLRPVDCAENRARAPHPTTASFGVSTHMESNRTCPVEDTRRLQSTAKCARYDS